MIRLTTLLLAVCALALVLGPTPVPASDSPLVNLLGAETAGKIKTVDADKNEFVITDSNNKQWTFTLAKDAKVLINDKEGKLADLQADNDVTITYEKEGNRLMASMVRCTRK
jgi:uncharacterized protein (DUF697 family)